MTKKRIGTIYGSPIIEGDKNLKTSNEIHVSELGGGGEGNNNGIEDVRYYLMSTFQEEKELAEIMCQGLKYAISVNDPYPIRGCFEATLVSIDPASVMAVAIDFNYSFDLQLIGGYFRGTLNELITFLYENGMEDALLIYSIPTITKEEFYALSKVEPINK